VGGFGENAAHLRAALALRACDGVIALAALAAWMGPALPAAAQLPDFAADERTPVEIRAYQVSLDRKRELYEAFGDVQLIQGDRELRADWMVFNSETGRGVASGNVRLTRGRDVLNASFLDFDADDLQGVVYDGVLDAPDTGFQMRGREIARTGEDTYHFEDGIFTTCICPNPEDRKPWQIEAGEADLEIGGYGTARNTTFDILEIPVLWFPWMIYPLKTERQTGLLFPDIGYSRRNGAEFGLPFFWAAHDQLNVTLTPRWLGKRGFKGDVELEYVLGERSFGSLFGAFLSDRSVDERTTPPPLFDAERWTVIGQQDFWLPADFRAKADFSFMSDNEYAFDFSDLHGKQKDRYLESQAFVFRHDGPYDRFTSMLSVAYADDLQSPDDQDRDRFLLQRLPRLEFSMLPEATPIPGLRWLTTAFDAEYTMFRPRDPAKFGSVLEDSFFDTGIDGIPDAEECGVSTSCGPDPHGDNFLGIPPIGSEGNGRFDEGEALADRGHRIDLWPRVSTPFRLFDRLEVLPEAGWRETLYFTEQQDTATRGFATGRIDLRTRVRGHVAGLLHMIEPRVGYVAVTGEEQFGNPRFVPETFTPQLRLREIEPWNRLADPSDRIRSFHGANYGVEQRFYREAAGGIPRLLADLLIAHQYDVQRDEFGSIFFDGRLYAADNFGLRFQLGLDPDPAGSAAPEIAEGLAQAAWNSRAGHQLSLEYRYLRDIPTFFEDFSLGGPRLDGFREISAVNQITMALKLALTQRWSLRYSANYSFDQSLLLSHSGSLEYFSKCECWGLGVEISDDRTRGVRYNVLYRIVGLGKGEGRGRRLLDER
jgi:lipopolysaccharide assembly outer membrane protein LptD (OstA)